MTKIDLNTIRDKEGLITYLGWTSDFDPTSEDMYWFVDCVDTFYIVMMGIDKVSMSFVVKHFFSTKVTNPEAAIELLRKNKTYLVPSIDNRRVFDSVGAYFS